MAGVAALALAGCTSDGGETPDYRPSPERTNVEGDPGARISPIIPVPSLSGSASAPGTGGQPPSSSAGNGPDPQVVATKLRNPVGLTLLPDGTALVGERTSGRIVRVQPQAGQPVPTVRTLSVDASGDGGLLDLALSPTYAEDSLVYAYLSTKRDNRVVAFTLKGPVTPVLTGIPHGSSGNGGRLDVTRGGALQLATGDTGRSSLATDRASLAGKVLRVTDIGSPAPGNPSSKSAVYASGLRQTEGLCAAARVDTTFELDRSGEVNVVARGGNYAATAPIARTPAATGATGDCAVQSNRLYVASLDGKQLLSAPITGSAAKPKLGTFSAALVNTYGRLRTVVPASDGALWLTTANRSGNGKPVAADERVIRYQPQGGGTDANPA